MVNHFLLHTFVYQQVDRHPQNAHHHPLAHPIYLYWGRTPIPSYHQILVVRILHHLLESVKFIASTTYHTLFKTSFVPFTPWARPMSCGSPPQKYLRAMANLLADDMGPFGVLPRFRFRGFGIFGSIISNSFQNDPRTSDTYDEIDGPSILQRESLHLFSHVSLFYCPLSDLCNFYYSWCSYYCWLLHVLVGGYEW